MANFQGICEWVLRQEDSTLSGKVVNLMDGQGLTRFGIGQHSHPNLPPDFYTCNAAQALADAQQIYKAEYWDRMLCDLVTSDEVASCLLNFGINDGIGQEVKLLQYCLVGIPVDGIMGSKTLAATNAADPAKLAPQLRQAQADWYHSLVAKQPTDARFLDGWLRRVALVYPNL